MPQDCAISLDHIQTVSRARIGAIITTLSQRKMDQVRPALMFALGFADD